MENRLYTRQEVVNFINSGRVMLLTGSQKALKGLPKGNWVGGSSPYFVDSVGIEDHDKIFVDDFTMVAQNCKTASFNENNIQNIAKDGFKNGFVVVVMPIDSKVHITFATSALGYDKMFDNPVVGYVSATTPDENGNNTSISVSGSDGIITDKLASVLYVELPDYLAARAEIENFDTIDEKSPKIIFPHDGFVQSSCTIDGKQANIAEFCDHTIKLLSGPNMQIITSQNGALINRVIRNVDLDKGEVTFFSSIVAGDEYRLVKSGTDYVAIFNRSLGAKQCDVLTCFSCVTYFFGGNFLGKNVCKNGIYAFGEIGYQLLNKTIVTLEIDKVK